VEGTSTVNLVPFRESLQRYICIKSRLWSSCQYKYKEKLVILEPIGIIVIKSKEARVVTYTCRYSWVLDELGIKCPLEYLQV